MNTSDLIYVGFWKRVKASLIDGVILLIPWYFIYKFLLNTKFAPICVVGYCFMMLAYFSIFVIQFGGTPGKLICHIRVINSSGKNISFLESLARQYINIISCIYTILSYLIYGKTNISIISSNLIGLWFFVDAFVLLFNNRRRTLHDFIANTYVIVNEEYLRKQNTKNEFKYTQNGFEDALNRYIGSNENKKVSE